jgi:hypothetical protein
VEDKPRRDERVAEADSLSVVAACADIMGMFSQPEGLLATKPS